MNIKITSQRQRTAGEFDEKGRPWMDVVISFTSKPNPLHRLVKGLPGRITLNDEVHVVRLVFALRMDGRAGTARKNSSDAGGFESAAHLTDNILQR